MARSCCSPPERAEAATWPRSPRSGIAPARRRRRHSRCQRQGSPRRGAGRRGSGVQTGRGTPGGAEREAVPRRRSVRRGGRRGGDRRGRWCRREAATSRSGSTGAVSAARPSCGRPSSCWGRGGRRPSPRAVSIRAGLPPASAGYYFASIDDLTVEALLFPRGRTQRSAHDPVATGGGRRRNPALRPAVAEAIAAPRPAEADVRSMEEAIRSLFIIHAIDDGEREALRERFREPPGGAIEEPG